MRYLITGGSGFIGSHLVDRLLAEGHEVLIIDRNVKYNNLPQKHSNLSIYSENIFGKVADLFQGVDYVVHMAALTRPQWSLKYPYETSEANVMGTIKLLEYSRDAKVRRFIFLSTSNLYGDNFYPTPEDAKVSPMNSYALSKSVGEQYCELFGRVYGLSWNAIRPFNAYGTRMPITGIYTSAVATYINALKNDIPFVKFGNGEQRRDFVYVDDVVEQIMLMTTSEVDKQVFNCGFGKNYSINEMLEMVRSIMFKRIEADVIDRQFEPDQTLADITKAERLLGWKPKIDLEEGLRRTIENSN